MILSTTPAAGAGTSMVAFSLSIDTKASSLSTAWPSRFSHCTICTSLINSPICGTVTSTVMAMSSRFSVGNTLRGVPLGWPR